VKSPEIRRRFLDFFAQRGHAVQPSSALVPERDPTLFFVNAGMVQFKNIFTGDEPRKTPRATTVQKCLRVSGKHNDLENVGRTPRHHTFFEMLGNFSFGDYFKRDAIEMAWKLLTGPESEGCFELDPERLWVTIYEDDDDAHEIWTQVVGFPEARLQRLGVKDNFWSMGDTGPCGPCTEIHYDHGPEVSDDERGPAGEDGRYVEIWNLVFMQYQQHADGTRDELPQPSIDTGMGLERLAAIKQGVYWNYDTDVFQGIIQRTAQVTGVTYGADDATTVALRVIADHARAAAFLIGDGVMPSNERRGYVLRRIMRRAIRFGRTLGVQQPFLWEAADQVVEEMGDAYPQLRERRAFIQEVVKGEEERFATTLDKGLQLLEQAMEGTEQLDGAVVFELYDTFGFPPDLTALIAGERGVTIDHAGFDACMAEAKERSRRGGKGSGDVGITSIESELAHELPETVFTGYDGDSGTSQVLAIVQDGGRADALVQGEARVVTRETPFYAESGGQAGDNGRLEWPGGSFTVTDTVKAPGGIHLHVGTLDAGTLRPGQDVALHVDGGRRDLTRLNHSATHLLHAALRNVLGDHVQQKGSLVDPNRLRFDFSHHKSLTADEVQTIQDRVNDQIRGNSAVKTQLRTLEQATEDGAMALFGEKYGDNVRVVSMGDERFSVELCGGTHATRTGDIGLFRITSEAGVAAGVRRIEGVTGPGAMAWYDARERAASQAAAALRTPVEELPAAIERLMVDRKRLERELDKLKLELARAAGGDLASQARDIDGIKVIAAELPGDVNTLRNEADRLRDQLGTAVVVLGSREGGSVTLIVAVTKDIAGKRAHAGNIVRSVAKMVGGGGGGRPDMAQAGGRNADALPAALESVYDLI
jgi:alanyl-tRNA synthetase